MINWGAGKIVTDGLVLNIDAANQRSYGGTGTTWIDMSGNRNNGTLVNGPSYSSENGGSLVFNGTNQTISVQNEVSTNGDWTLSYWQNVIPISQNDFSLSALLAITPAAGSSAPGYIGVGWNAFTSVSAIHIDSSDNIYVGGQYGGYDNIVRDTLVKINPDGSPNTQFNSGRGIANAAVIAVGKIQQLSNGNLVTCGTNWFSTGTGLINSITGVFLPSFTTGLSSICASFILHEPTNSLWVLDSWATSYQGQNITGKIFKVNLTTFAIDTTFISSSGFKSAVGKVTVSETEGVNDGIVLQDGNLLCTGSFLEYKGVPCNRIVKINSTTAALDTSFVYGTGFNATVNRAVQLNNGTIVIVGAFTSYNGNTRNRIIGLNNDGSINSSFDVGTGFNSTVYSIIYDSVNDKLFCFGLFTTYKGVSANRIVKLNSDGSIDTSFNYGTGFNTTTYNGALDTQGRLVVLGETTLKYQGQTIPRRICRINPNGTLDTSFSSGGFNIDRFRSHGTVRLTNNTVPFITGFYGINGNREIINLPGGAMDFNGYKHYSVSYNSATNQIFGYVNGVLRRTYSLATSYNFRCKSIFSSGNLVNFMIYNRLLSTNEILQNYNATKKRFDL